MSQGEKLAISLQIWRMTPDFWRYNGKKCTLGHLRPSNHSFRWASKAGADGFFHGRLRYSTHCISIANNGLPADPANLLHDAQGKPRVFDYDRYLLSLTLPALITGLFDKPTTTIRPTTQANYFVFQMPAPEIAARGEKYYAFFQIQYKFQQAGDPAHHHFELFVESAYCRSAPPQTPHHKPTVMFGQLLENLARQGKAKR